MEFFNLFYLFALFKFLLQNYVCQELKKKNVPGIASILNRQATRGTFCLRHWKTEKALKVLYNLHKSIIGLSNRFHTEMNYCNPSHFLSFPS